MQISVVDLMVAASVVHETATIDEARRALIRRQAQEVFVVDVDGRLRGVVPDYEFLKAEISGVSATESVIRLLSTRIETIESDADVFTLLPKFREAWCSRVAVVRRGRFVGQVRRGDVLRLILELQQVARMTEAVAEQQIIAGPYFERKRARLTPVKPLQRASGRRIRKLRAG